MYTHLCIDDDLQEELSQSIVNPSLNRRVPDTIVINKEQHRSAEKQALPQKPNDRVPKTPAHGERSFEKTSSAVST